MFVNPRHNTQINLVSFENWAEIQGKNYFKEKSFKIWNEWAITHSKAYKYCHSLHCLNRSDPGTWKLPMGQGELQQWSSPEMSLKLWGITCFLPFKARPRNNLRRWTEQVKTDTLIWVAGLVQGGGGGQEWCLAFSMITKSRTHKNTVSTHDI